MRRSPGRNSPELEFIADPRASDGSGDDAVVQELVSRGVVSSDTVEAMASSKAGGGVSYQDLALNPAAPRSTIFEVAAELAGVERVSVDAYTPPDDLVRSILGLFDENVASGLLAAGLLPVELLTDATLADFSIAFATHDPMGFFEWAAHDHLGIKIVLRYADEDDLRDRILSIGFVTEEQVERAWGRPLEFQLGDDTAPTDDQTGGGVAPLPQPDPEVVRWLDDGEGGSAETANLVAEAPAQPETPAPVEPQETHHPPTDSRSTEPADSDEHTPRQQAQGAGRTDKYDLETLKGALRDRVVGVLVQKELVTESQVLSALEVQKSSPREVLWRLLANIKGVDREAVFREAAAVYAFRAAEVSDRDPKFAKLVMDSFPEQRRDELLKMSVFPIEYEADTATGGAKLVFVTHDPARPEIQRILHQQKIGRFQLYYAPEAYVASLIQEAFPRRNEFLERMTDADRGFDLGMSFEDEEGLVDESALEAEISRSTLINLFEATLLEATRRGASDIHVFPNANRKIEIHFRIDGRLSKWHVEEKVHPEALLAVIKDNSRNVDRFERDAAQDGFIQRRIDDAIIRYRVSVLPIATAVQEIRAESIVIRVLDDRKVVTDLARLGMLDVALDRFNQAIRQPHGMVILTGPTGSGKSTTLVAALHQVVSPEINVLTVEDPVEYIISGVRQIKLNHKLDLEQAMRAILRHDPDVVMVGEMRDKATADLAIKLANTGHLAFSTLHTNDAPSAVSRLYKMGVEPFLLATAINLVVAQRLIRTLCPTCKVVDEDVDRVLARQIGFSDKELKEITFYNVGSAGKKCQSCRGTGYKGRRALCETLYFSRAIRHLILESAEKIDEDAIREQGRKEGMLTLQDSAREIVKMGDTSLDELIRVTAVE